MVDYVRIHVGKGGTDRVEVRKHQQGGESDKYPRPRPDRIVGQLKQEHRARGINFTLGGEHALRNVSTAARLGAWVPEAPPLNGKGNDEYGDHQFRIGEVGKECQPRSYVWMRQ